MIRRPSWQGLAWPLLLLPMVWLGMRTPSLAIALALCVSFCLAFRIDFTRSCLYLIVALVPLESIGQLGAGGVIPLSVTKLVFPLALASLLFEVSSGRRRLVLHASLGWGLAFGIALAASFIVNERTPFAWTSLRRYAAALAFFFFASNAPRSVRDIRHLLTVLYAACLFSALAGWLAPWFGGQVLGAKVHWEGSARMIGLSTVNPNSYASQILVALLFGIYGMVLFRGLPARLALAAGTLVLLHSIVHSYSRAVFFCSLLSAAYLGLRLRKPVGLPRLVLAALLLSAVALPRMPPDYLERIRSLVSEEVHTDSSLQRRWSYHVIGLRLASQHPLLGIGPGNFQREYMSETYRFETDTFGQWRLIHNLYLSILTHLGLAGLLSFLGLVALSFRLAWRVRRLAEDPEARHLALLLDVGLFSFLANSFFLPHEYQKFMWLFLGAIPALHAVAFSGREFRPPDGSTPAAPHTLPAALPG
jgi:O-antigen ligase